MLEYDIFILGSFKALEAFLKLDFTLDLYLMMILLFINFYFLNLKPLLITMKDYYLNY
jgi:hypothetical protein